MRMVINMDINNPKLSIIIPTYNQHDLTAQCLDQIYTVGTQDYEIILIDNGSEPPQKLPYYGQIIRNESNLGFPVAVNQGIQAAKGEYIILLNNDCIVTPGWDTKLIDCLNSGYAIAGPMTNYCAGLQQTNIPVYHNIDELNENAKSYTSNYKGNIYQDVNFIIGFCMAFRKSLFDEIGPFDESLWPCSGEEVDFCLRTRQWHKKIAICRDTYIHHIGSQTFKDMEANGQLNYGDVCVRNDKHLVDRWGEFWTKQDVNGVECELNINENINYNPDVEAIRLNLGCGYSHIEGYINIDNREVVNPDILCDILSGLPYESNSIDEIRAFDFLEHIPIGKTIDVITEIWRVLKPNGIFKSFTPSTDGRGAFQDPTHVSFWNYNSWMYYTDPLYRKLYDIKADFAIEQILDSKDESCNIVHTYAVLRARK